jgi:hypothetical protein
MKGTNNEQEPTCIRAREARERRSKMPHTKRETPEETIVSDGEEISMAPRHVLFFWKNIKKTERCWEWVGSKWELGYGRIMIGSKRRKAHRISFLLHNGFLPKDKLVCHACDNPSCCNPAHLFIGTPMDNSRDAVSKLRHAYGERNGISKLTEQDVHAIRQAHAPKNRSECSILAKKFGVSISTIYHVRSNSTWKIPLTYKSSTLKK